MKFLDKKVSEELKTIFANLDKEVTLHLFTQPVECRFCLETHELLSEVVSYSSKLKLETFDFVKDKDKVECYHIDKIPAIAIVGEKDYGIRFFGIPAGYEFASLIQAINLVSSGKPSLNEKTIEFIQSLQKDIHIQVMVTPTCPYCTGAVILAHQLAYSCERIKSDMVEITEFPTLAQKYKVMGVPRTIINETEFVDGAVGENVLIEKIQNITK